MVYEGVLIAAGRNLHSYTNESYQVKSFQKSSRGLNVAEPKTFHQTAKFYVAKFYSFKVATFRTKLRKLTLNEKYSSAKV